MTNVNDVLRAFLKGKPGVRHDKLKCSITKSEYRGQRSAEGGTRWKWELEATCPECGRKGRFLRADLREHTVLCDGIKFTKELPA